MPTINKRIKERRLALKLTLLEIANKLGIKEATVQRYESGEIKNIKHETIVNLARILNCSPAYLMGWENEIETKNTPVKNLSSVTTKQIPILDPRITEQPIFAKEHVASYATCKISADANFCLQVKDDSMINARIQDGDIVFIREQTDVEDGEIAAVLINNEATLKRVFKMPGRIQLRAENPKYEPINLGEEEYKTVQILGKAIAFQGTMR